MKISKPTFSLLLSILISACSGGGGGSSPESVLTNMNSSSADDSFSSAGDSASAAFGLMLEEIETITSAVKVETSDGSIIDLELSPKGLLATETANGLLAGMNNDSSFYGVWMSNDLDQYEVRYQGIEATNIPTVGTAVYQGNAFWVNNADGSLRQGGRTTLNVDFGNKSVEGAIAFANSSGNASRGDITLHKSTLSGAGFGGRASVAGGLEGRYSGALYGDGATEAAGWVGFADANNSNIAFGGVKQ